MDALTWDDAGRSRRRGPTCRFDQASDQGKRSESVSPVVSAVPSLGHSDHDQQPSEASTALCFGKPQLVIDFNI